MAKTEKYVTNPNTYSRTIITQWFKRLLPAQILSQATASLGSIINGMVVGNFLPPEALMAIGFVVPMTAMLGALGTAISGGGRILGGQYIGRNDSKMMDEVFTTAVLLCTVLGTVLTVAGLVLSGPMACLFGATGEATAPTAEYIRGVALGFIPMLLVPTLIVFLQIGNEINYAFASSLVLALVNLAGGLVNVKLLGGSIFGMGVAGSVSQLVTVLFLAFRFVQKKHLVRLRRPEEVGKLGIKLLATGSPMALAMLLYATRNTVINALALHWGGNEAVSALAILNSAMGPFDAVNHGVLATALILASVFVGERDNYSMNLLVRISLRIGLPLAGAKMAVLALGGKWLAMLFGAEGSLVETTYVLVVIYSLSMPLNILTSSILAPYQAMGRIKLTNAIYVFNAFIFSIAWCVLMGSKLGVTAMWFCYGAAEALSLPLIALVCRIKGGQFPRNISQWLWMDEKKNDADKLSISVRNMEQVINVSEQLIDFCLSHGIDSRRSKLVGLCMEEMAGNVVSHGFSQGKPGREYVIDLFVCVENDGVTMRLRDNAPPFDPRIKFGMTDREDPCKNIGIRMVTAISKEINYQSCFGMNVVGIEL